MRFLVIQMIIVILVCIFIATLANLTEMGIVGWIIAGSSGHALYKIYKHMYYSSKSGGAKRKCVSCDSEVTDFSGQIESFMFDDVTGVNEE